jgi:PAS domain S-box-containing protein
MHNGEEAAKYHSRADEIKSREAELSNQATAIDGKSTVAAVISISEDGTIDSVNKVLCAMFAYERLTLIGRNIKCIVPSPWKEKHDLFLDNYINTGEAKVVGKPARKLFAQHREGYSFAMNLSIQERRNENGERSFVALINRTDRDKQEGVILITGMGQMLLVSEAVTKLFGYSAVECLRNVLFLQL